MFPFTHIGGITWLFASLQSGCSNILMEGFHPQETPEVLARVRAIATGWPGTLAFHDLKTRMAGSKTFISLHLEMDGRQSLNDAHAVADALEHRLEEAVPGAEVIIHLDPVGEGSGRVARG